MLNIKTTPPRYYLTIDFTVKINTFHSYDKTDGEKLKKNSKNAIEDKEKRENDATRSRLEKVKGFS